ncbi:MAG: cytochrome C biosynthesis protein [Mucinivorans sp.]
MAKSNYILVLLTCAALAMSCSTARITASTLVDTLARTFPDVAGVTIPASCAPLNFEILEDGERFYTEISTSKSSDDPIIIESSNCEISIPEGRWRELLQKATGQKLTVRLAVERNGKWIEYQSFPLHISARAMDNYLVYRLIDPGYSLWGNMGIYERELSSFAERTLIDNRSTQMGCMNCHTFSSNSPEKMMLHLRAKQTGTLIMTDGKVSKVKFKTGSMYSEGIYPAWSGDGDFIAYSINEIQQAFHAWGDKPIEVYDLRSDLVVYDVRKNQLTSSASVFGDQFRETFPEWSPDGKWLYFCRAPRVDSTAKAGGGVVEESRYDVCRVAFDRTNCTFDSVEIIYPASTFDRSASFVKCSPDGRYLIFALSDYGNFSIWHPESDLYVMDLRSGVVRAADEINSNNTESYHSFSSNGSWLVFSSRRIDGLYTRPYIAYFDLATGHFAKPFLLPQEKTDHYERQMQSYNIPQFVNGKVDSRKLIQAVEIEAQSVKLR